MIAPDQRRTCSVLLMAGDLVNRALLREPANLLILNASRSDSAKYRCEVVAIDDHKPFDEILISLAVRGTLIYLINSASINCP